MLNKSNVYHWFNTKIKPYDRGYLVLEDGTLIPFTYDFTGTVIVRDTDAVGVVHHSTIRDSWNAETTCPHTCATHRVEVDTAAEGASFITFVLAEADREVAALAADPVLRAEHLITRMDWYSAMSDDHGVWAAGERRMRELRHVLKEITPEKARLLWEAHAPDGFICPV
jgi:hypothetical protein